MKNYILLDITTISDISKINLENYSEVHINLLRLEKSNQNIDDVLLFVAKNYIKKDVFFYSSSLANMEKIKKNNFKIHYCFFGNSLLSIENVLKEEIKKTESEVFWFPNKQSILTPKSIITKKLKEMNIPICFYITNSLIETDYEFEEIYKLIIEINKDWQNPLFLKEQEIEVSNWYFNDFHSELDSKKNKLVMGLFGDIPVFENENLEKINKRKMLSSKECVVCDNYEKCANRGIGLIMENFNTKKCLGIKLFKK